MKKLLFLLLLAFSVTAYSQGVKKPVKSDSITVHGVYKNDTAKVAVIFYVEDGSFTWQKGYLVSRAFIPSGGSAIRTGEQLFNHKWEAVKPDDVYDVKAMGWK